MKIFNGYFVGNLLLNDYEIKVGVDFECNEIFNVFFQNIKGVYIFISVDFVVFWVMGVFMFYQV